MAEALTDITHYLLRQSCQVAAVFTAMAAACWVLRGASAHWRYMLWLVVVAACLVPPVVTVPVPVLPATGPRSVDQGPTPAGMPGLPETQAQPALPPGTNPPSFGGSYAPVHPAPGRIETPPHPASVHSAASGGRAETVPRLTVAQWAAVGWIAGAAGFFSLVLLKAWRIRRRLRRTSRPPDTGLQGEVRALAGRLGIGAAAKVLLADGIGQPFVWGVFRGSIYLPGDFCGGGSAEDRRGMLAHELAHISRWDAAVNAVQILVQGIFFFHPLIWWANRKIRQEREKCCDETAIASLGVPPKEYSNAIVDALVTEHTSRQPLGSLAIAGPAENIEERIRTIMRPSKKFHKRPTWSAIITALILVALGAPTAPVLTAREQAPVETGEPEPAVQPSTGEDESVVMVPCRTKYSVMLVVGRHRMTFEGHEATWERLPALLASVPHRDRTVFAVALAEFLESNSTPERKRAIMSRAGRLCRRFGFEGLSFVGVHPLGSKGGARYEAIVTPRPHDAVARALRPGGPTRRRCFVRLVLGRDKTTFEGRETSPAQLPSLLAKVPSRGQTVLEVAIPSEDVSAKALMDALGLAKRCGFEYGSYVGVHPLGSKGSPAQTIAAGKAQPAAGPALRRFVGLWRGLAVDKPAEGTSRDPLCIEVRVSDDGRLKGVARGRFVMSGKRDLQNVRLEGGRLKFELLHRTDTRMAVTLEWQDGKLQGEAIPLMSDEDACDITLTRVPEAPRVTTATVEGPRTPLQAARRFVGMWSGLAVDKPEEGTSTDPLTIELRIGNDGRLQGVARDRFVMSGKTDLQNVRLERGRLKFDLVHRTHIPMAVTLEWKDGKLEGEAIPTVSEGDACDITLNRARAETTR